MDKLSRLVVLISGNGSNLQAILDACQTGRVSAQVVGVVSNQALAYGLVRAKQAGVETMILERTRGQERNTYDAILADKVAALNPDWVILAGWMRILTMEFLGRFPNRVVNLHPALPGTFAGTHAIERSFVAWQNGEIDHTGVMVHLVPDEGVDVGPVLAKEEISFIEGESLELFEQRLHELEHRLLIETIQTLTSQPKE
ncbi:MAG TPA: phosphoribosylglycinamide formyltransferase [Anaerolineales bacterium]|nr:phosphoribosylglycinamide formyltransferase [Anaerolineales bacterium]